MFIYKTDNPTMLRIRYEFGEFITRSNDAEDFAELYAAMFTSKRWQEKKHGPWSIVKLGHDGCYKLIYQTASDYHSMSVDKLDLLSLAEVCQEAADPACRGC